MKYFDLHCDTATAAYVHDCNLFENIGHVDLKRGSAFDTWVQVFAIFINDDYRGNDALERFNQIHAFISRTIEGNEDKFNLIQNNGSFEVKPNICNMIISVEGGCVLTGSLENISMLKQHNIKLLTLTWNGDNELGSGVLGSGGRLTRFGVDCIRELERNNIAIDISHLNERGVDDVFTHARQPLLASHSNSFECCDHIRNLNKSQIKYLIENNGLCGLNLYTKFLTHKDECTLDDFHRHIDYILSLGGENILAIGSDFDGAVMPDFCKDISCIQALDKCVSKWYNKEIAEKIFYTNAYNFFNMVKEI